MPTQLPQEVRPEFSLDKQVEGRSQSLNKSGDDPGEIERLRKVRVGGQAEGLGYTDKHPVMNLLGRLYIRVMSWLSYLY